MATTRTSGERRLRQTANPLGGPGSPTAGEGGAPVGGAADGAADDAVPGAADERSEPAPDAPPDVDGGGGSSARSGSLTPGGVARPAQKLAPARRRRHARRVTGPARPSAALSLGLCLALGLGAAAGCAPSGRPYRFSSPLIGGAELPRGPAPAFDDGDEGAGERGGPQRGAPTRRERVAMAPIRTERDPDAIARHRGASPATAKPGVPAAPPSAKKGAGPGLVPGLAADASPDDPRSWVGVRDDADPLHAVVGLCARKNRRCPGREEDLALLAKREAWLPAATPFDVGDLLLFDRVGLDNKEQIFALVTAKQQRGVFEIAYVAAGVWRRGLIDPMRPRLHRDGQGRVVNTYLRHRRASLPAGTRFLSGELLVGVLPLGSSANDGARPALAASAR